MQSFDFRDRSVREGATDQSRLKILGAAHQRLVEQRLGLIKSLSAHCQAEQSEAHIDLLIRVQKAIEVVDKAINDEQLAPQAA